MGGEQRLPECPLSGAGHAGDRPVGIRHRRGGDDVHVDGRPELHRSRDVRHGVERPEPGMHHNLGDRRGWIDRTVDGADAPAAQATADTAGTPSASLRNLSVVSTDLRRAARVKSIG